MKQQPATLKPLSTGAELKPAAYLEPETTTLLLFITPSKAEDKAFLTSLQASAEGKPVALRLVHLPKGGEPVAKQFEVTTTPCVLVYDRRGRKMGVASDLPQTIVLAKKAIKVARIDWMQEGTPLFESFQKQSPFPIRTPDQLPDIMRTMSLKPEVMVMIQEVAGRMHFSNGALTRREKEMIASYVSALNKCKY